MEASCKGAKEAGGFTIGILPSLDGKDANDYLDVIIPTGFGYARNSLVVSSADIVIAINGSSGTLSEIAMALNYNRPVIAVTDSGGIAGKIQDISKSDPKLDMIKFSEHEKAVETALKFF